MARLLHPAPTRITPAAPFGSADAVAALETCIQNPSVRSDSLPQPN